MKHSILTALMVFAVSVSGTLLNETVFAAGDVAHPKAQEWSFNGVFGTYDKGALQRGLQVYREVCAACHGLKRIRFREFEALGYSPEQVKALASEYTVEDGPNDEGEMFERAGIPADRLNSPFPNENAARFANGGAYPVDLSLIVKARHGGADYIYGLLTGYTEPPHGKDLVEGKHYNKYYPGHWVSMAAPLSDGQVTYSNGESATAKQAARDVAHFLAWASEPEMEQRKRLGVQVIMFLIILSGLMYAVKKKVWSGLK